MTRFTVKYFLKLLSISLLLGFSIGTLGNAFEKTTGNVNDGKPSFKIYNTKQILK